MPKIEENDFSIFEGYPMVSIGRPYAVLTNNRFEKEVGVIDYFTERFLFVNNYLDSVRIGFNSLVRKYKSFGIEDLMEFVTNLTLENAGSQFRSLLSSKYKESGNKELCFTKVEFREVEKKVFIHEAINGPDIMKNLKAIEGITSNGALKEYIERVEEVASYFKFVQVK